MKSWSWLTGIWRSLAARVALVLMIGMTAASIASLLMAEHGRVLDLERVRRERVVASTLDILGRLNRDPVRTSRLLREDEIFGAREASAEPGEMRPDPELGQMLRTRFAPGTFVAAATTTPSVCFSRLNFSIMAAGNDSSGLPDCWFLHFIDAHGVERRLLIDTPPFKIAPSSTLGPFFLSTIVAASALLSLLAAGLATAPLRRLTRAARAFSIVVDPERIPVRGPREVRLALATFNLMQERVREGFRERTQILAGIAHDLQTPVTRLRLRLEDVESPVLKARLIHDLAAVQKLVRDGLDLARSSEIREPWSVVDIDSILSSVAEDASEFGADVRFVSGCGVQARVKPNALARCVNNLVDNAVKYAGDAELSSERVGQDLVIRIRDHGPGIAEAALEEAFAPFRRLGAAREGSKDGVGLGLAIARAQAQTFGAKLSLASHAAGGLEASILIDLTLTGSIIAPAGATITNPSPFPFCREDA
ncbi:MAG: ATP-binding protein [Caulobacteraceae bacterium]